MTNKQFIYNDWAEDTLYVIPATIYGPDQTRPPTAPALVFHAHTGPELPVSAVRDLRDYLTQWLTDNAPADQDKAPARD